MYKIYQLQHINATYDLLPDGEVINYVYDIKLNPIGEWSMKNQIDVNKTLEDIWHGCNVDCWDEEWKGNEPVVLEDITLYPLPDFKGYCNSDIVVETPEGLFKANTSGWSKVDNLDDAMYMIIWSYPAFKWDEIRNKSELDYNKFIEIGKKIEKEC